MTCECNSRVILHDLQERLEKAELELRKLAAVAEGTVANLRLSGKREGVSLAAGYLYEMTRSA